MPGDLGYPFKQAKWYERWRDGYNAIWIVWHCTDDDEHPTYAEGLGNYFATSDRRVSTHFGADNDSAKQYVLLADTAFGAGNTQGNLRGVHIEHSGRANQTRAQWLDAFGQGLLDRSAELNAKLLNRLNIPFTGKFLTDAELKARKPGITRHGDLVRVFGGTHHGCPGANFPADELFKRIGALLNPPPEEDDMLKDELVSVPAVPQEAPGDLPKGDRKASDVLAYTLARVASLQNEVDVVNDKLDVVIGLLTEETE